MAKKSREPNQGHILAKFDIAQVLAHFLRVQFKIYNVANRVRDAASDVLGMARKEDFDKLSEEIDRVAGKIEKGRL